MKIGDRVSHAQGIGIVENVDGQFSDVRWLTPNNEPSCCVSLVLTGSLIKVQGHVVPMQRSKSWWDESRSFCNAIKYSITVEGREYD